MTCEDYDQDLLLYGLGELPDRQRRQIARHLRTCARCRARQAELAAVSGQIAAALRPPAVRSGRTTGSGSAVLSRPIGRSPGSRALLLALGLLVASLFAVWYIRTHHAARAGSKNEACRPDLPSDQCR